MRLSLECEARMFAGCVAVVLAALMLMKLCGC